MMECDTMAYAVLSYEYAGFEIEEPIGEAPQLTLKIKVIAKKIEGGRTVYVPPMKCDVHLLSATSFHPGGGSVIGYLGSYITTRPVLIWMDHDGETEFRLPMNSPKIEKMLEVRRNRQLACLEVRVSGFCFVCDGTGENRPIIVHSLNEDYVKKHTPTGELTHYIVFSSEELTELIQKVKHYELVRFEVPVYRFDKPSNNHVAKAVDLLQSASEKLSRGDSIGALKDVRDSIMNHLTVSLKEDDKTHRRFRKDIVDAFLKKVPQEAKNEYEKALEEVENELTSLLQNFISKFIHLDSDIIERAPLHEDVEYAYSVTVYTARYLAKYLVR
jgi:hypothetical protein